MTRAESLVKSLQADLESIQKRLHLVNIGNMRKVDCNQRGIASAVLQLNSLSQSLPALITHSED